jgi:hypothetical protein
LEALAFLFWFPVLLCVLGAIILGLICGFLATPRRFWWVWGIVAVLVGTAGRLAAAPPVWLDEPVWFHEWFGVGKDLRRAQLAHADLRHWDLLWANQRDADLRGALLQGVSLRGADLHGADLRGAKVKRVNLRGADLSSVNMSGADLEEASF